jgi:hypothetical protein
MQDSGKNVEQDSGCRIRGERRTGFRMQDSGFGGKNVEQDSGFGIQESGFRGRTYAVLPES